MSRNRRHRLLQRLLWSPAGLRLIAWCQRFERRWNYVVLNRSLHGPTNGEHWLISQLPKDPVILDVGFNNGDFSLEILHRHPTARIFAFDPARSSQRAFATLFSGNDRLRFHPVALSDQSGEAKFFDSGDMNSSLVSRHSSAETIYTVPALTIDHFLTQHPLAFIDLLKIDAEGYDLNVLEGAQAALEAQVIGMFMFEYADGWIDNRRFLKEVFAYFSGKPYKLFRLFNGFLAPVDYNCSHERYDLGCMFVGVSHQQLATRPIRERSFPF